MTQYTPDNWVILKIKGKTTHYRVLAGWSESYLNGSSWRMNSGITEAVLDGDYWIFSGSSGSIYKCHKDMYGLRINNAYVYNNLKDKHGDKVEMLHDSKWEQPDWDWVIE